MSWFEDGAGLYIKENTQRNYVQVMKDSLFHCDKN